MIALGAFSCDSACATTKALRPVSGLNGITATCSLGSSSMSMPPWCVSVIVGARKCVSSVSEKYTSWSAGTPASKVTPLLLALWWPWRCSQKYSRSFSASAVFRSPARPTRPALPFLPTPPLNTGLMNTWPCLPISALISASLASGPRISGVGKPASFSRRAPCSMPVRFIESVLSSRPAVRGSGRSHRRKAPSRDAFGRLSAPPIAYP